MDLTPGDAGEVGTAADSNGSFGGTSGFFRMPFVGLASAGGSTEMAGSPDTTGGASISSHALIRFCILN